MTAASPTGFRRPQLAAASIVAVVMTAMLLTSGQMAGLRELVPPLSRALGWLDRVPGPFDMYHVVFFALAASALRIVLPEARVWRLLALLGALAVGTELLQFATVGRTPRLLDARDDMLGACIGLLLGSLPLWCRPFVRQFRQVSAALVVAGIVLLPLQQWPVAHVLGFPLMGADVLLMLALVVRLFALASGNAPARIDGFHGWLLAYLFAMLMAVLVLPPSRAGTAGNGFSCPLPSPSFGLAWAKWIGLVWLVALAALACDMATDRIWLRRAAFGWLAAAALTALAALVASVGFYAGEPVRAAVAPLLSHYGSLPPGPYPRISGLFANANMAGLFLLLSTGVASAAHDAGWLTRRHLQAFLVLMAVPLLATASQAVGAVVLLLAGWWWHRGDASRLSRRLVLAAGAGFALVILALLLVNPAAPFAEPSVRMQLWQHAWLTWQGAFWRGTGLGQPAVSLDYLPPDGAWQQLSDAHHIVLNLGAQGGVFAVSAFCGLVAWVAWRTRLHAGLWAARAALLLGVVYLGIGGSFEDARALWVFMGLLAGAGIACAASRTPRPSAP